MNAALSVVPFYFQSNEIRTALIQDSPWFVARDVCSILGLENVTNALARIPENHKGVNPINTLGGVQQMATISEPGLYRLVLRSDKPQAEPFMEWITSEVLPAIRKTGHYSFSDDDFFVPATEGPAAVTVPRLEEAARGVKAAMIMARAYGWKNEQARQYTNRLVKEITGIDTLALLNIPEPETQPAASLDDSSTEIGRNVLAYLAERCDIDRRSRTASTALYNDFCEWYAKHFDKELPDRKAFGSTLGRRFHRLKSHGTIYYVGIALKAKEVRA